MLFRSRLERAPGEWHFEDLDALVRDAKLVSSLDHVIARATARREQIYLAERFSDHAPVVIEIESLLSLTVLRAAAGAMVLISTSTRPGRLGDCTTFPATMNPGNPRPMAVTSKGPRRPT